MSGWWLRLALFSFVAWVRPVAAGTCNPAITLFSTDGTPAHNYDSLVESLGAGNCVLFSSGKKIKLVKDLGGKESSRVFGVGRNRAIKIAKTKEAIPLLNEILEGYHEIKALAPTVAIFPDQSLSGEYIWEEELIPHHLIGRLVGLDDFNSSHFPPNQIPFTLLATELVKFARKAFRVAHFGDQGSAQIHFTNRGWVVTDYRRGHLVAKSAWDLIPFQRQYVPATGAACGGALSRLIYDVSEIGGQRMLIVPDELETAVRLSVLEQRIEFFGGLRTRNLDLQSPLFPR
ncbi:hypothetical protein K2X33_13155 [bacterium]|nr:hypothetical protein [bacterium]